MSVTLKTNCPKCNADQLKAHTTCGDTTVVLKFKCATCGHVFSAHLVEASAWRQDTWFCTIARQLWSADYKLATRRNERGSFEYDQGAGQRLLYRWQGVQMLLAPGEWPTTWGPIWGSLWFSCGPKACSMSTMTRSGKN